MIARRNLIVKLLLVIPLALSMPLLAQQTAAPVSQNQQDLNLQPLASDSASAPAQTTAPPSRPQSWSSTPARDGWHRFDEPDPVEHPALPMSLTVPAGSTITLRLNQGLSSDHSRPGDIWSGTLMQPLIADGRVVARRGQTVSGTVTAAERAGQVKGISKLGLALNQLTLADGRLMPIKAQLIEFHGPTTKGRDAAGMAAAVGTGAAIGGIFGGGLGAGIGAAAGAVAGTIGVLVTRGEPTIIPPESLVSYRVEEPLSVTVNTPTSARAFVPVRPSDYQSGGQLIRPGPTAGVAAPAPTAYAASPYYPYYGPYSYSPYNYWPSIGLYWGWGPGWYGGYGYYGYHGHNYYGYGHGHYGHGGGYHGGGHGGHH